MELDYLPQSERFLGLDDQRAAPERARAVVVPVPFEKTSSYGVGSADGPAAIIRASHQVEFFDCWLEMEPWLTTDGIVTLEPMGMAEMDGQKLATVLERTVLHLLEQQRLVISIGGEHTSIVGAVWAHARQWPDMTVLQLDAHSDLRREYDGDPWSHACAMTRVMDCHERLVQVGIRSAEYDEWELGRRRGIPVFHAEHLHEQERCGLDWVNAIIATLGPRVYLSIDCDVLDPCLLPATGTPDPGGLSWLQINRLLVEICRRREVVGFDVSELAPISGLDFPQYSVAKLIYRLIGLVRRSQVAPH